MHGIVVGIKVVGQPFIYNGEVVMHTIICKLNIEIIWFLVVGVVIFMQQIYFSTIFNIPPRVGMALGTTAGL